MKNLTARIASNEKVREYFHRMSLVSPYLAKTAKPGQFVEVRCAKGVNPLLRRPLGIHRITSDGVDVLYEVVGKGTGLLSQKGQGEELGIIGPLGKGFIIDPAADISILVAGGIGVAPMMALAEELKAKGRQIVHVLIGARKASHVLCEREFRSLGCKVRISTDDGSKGYKGLVTDPLRKLLAESKVDTFLPDFRRVTIYACGPTGMLRAVSGIAQELGIKCQVSLEERMACGVGICLGCPVKVRPTGEYKMVCKDGPVFDSTEIAW